MAGNWSPGLPGAADDALLGLTDARLSGSGVAAGSWGPLATGASLAREVVLTVDAAGVYAPLGSQSVAIVNNFDNTRSQLLVISSASGATAYNLAAAAAVTPNPVVLANQRQGGVARAGEAALSAQLALLNTAIGPADALRGAFDLGNAGTGDHFVLSGFDAFGEVAAGGSFSGLQIGFGSGWVGSFDKVVVLRSFGFNASGYDGALGDLELRLRGSVVAMPEPGSYRLIAATG